MLVMTSANAPQHEKRDDDHDHSIRHITKVHPIGDGIPHKHDVMLNDGRKVSSVVTMDLDECLAIQASREGNALALSFLCIERNGQRSPSHA